MIFRLTDFIGSGDAQPEHVDAQFGERLFVSEAGYIVGAVWRQHTAAHADEKILKIVIEGLDRRAPRGRGKLACSLAERRLVAYDGADLGQHFVC